MGSHAGCSLISQGLAQEIVYIDVDRKVAAGPLPDMGQTGMDPLRQTVAVMKDVTEAIRMSGFAGIILNISNPADVITHYIQHQRNWPLRRLHC